MTGGRQSSEWFVKDDNGVRGPLSESELRRTVRKSSDPKLQVKQGDSDWYPAAVIRVKMDELAACGIYIRCKNVAEGPFTIARANQLLQTVNADGVEVRTGKSGDWVSADAWLSAIRRLERKQRQKHRQTVAADDDPPPAHGQSDSSQDLAIVEDDSHSEAEVENNELVEATLVDSEPVLEAIPVTRPREPVATPNSLVAVASQTASEPVRPFIAKSVDTGFRPASSSLGSHATNRIPGNASGVGSLGIKIGSVVLSACVLFGILAVKALKLGGKQALQQQQAETRADREGSGMFGSGQSHVVTASEESGRIEGGYRRPDSESDAAATAGPATARATRPKPPVVVPGMLFRPQFVTRDGVVDAGTAFAARIDGGADTYIISALHLFGPAGGLHRDIPAASLSDRWQGLSLRDCKSNLLHADVPMQPVPLALAKPLPQRSAQGDVAVCALRDAARLSLSPLGLARARPQSGEPVWLVSEVIGSSSLVHRAEVEGIQAGWLVYQFDRPVELRATSGAPVVNGSGQVVAVNAGGGEDGGATFGVGTPTANFVTSVLNRQ